MDSAKKPVEQYYYSKEEWDRLGCGPLPPERDIEKQRRESLVKTIFRGNPRIDGNAVKGYN